jgi:hypothetical protein
LIAKILDLKNSLIDTFNGKFQNGVFRYQIGGWNLWFIGRKGGIWKDLPFDINKCIYEGKGKIAYYRFDGKNYKQLSFEEMKVLFNPTDLIRDFEIGELHKQLMLPKPFSLKDIINFIMIIMTIAVVVAVIYVLQHVETVLTLVYAPLNKTMSYCINTANLQYNQTKYLIKLVNASIIRQGVSIQSGG